MRSRLLAARGKVRHPDLGLWRFVADAEVLSDPEGDEWTDGSVPEDERESAELRKASLLVAATDIVDWCIDDIQMIEFADDEWPEDDSVEESFVYAWFPRRHRRAYDEDFFRKVLIIAVQVAAVLADPQGAPHPALQRKLSGTP